MITPAFRIFALLFVSAMETRAQHAQRLASPIGFVVGAAPNGSTDTVARAIIEWQQNAINQLVVLEIPSLEQAGVEDGATDLWWGALAPAGPPAPVVMNLKAEINKAFLPKEGG